MLNLEIIEAPSNREDSEDTFVVGPAGASLGRTNECDWRLQDESNQISRLHCRILCTGNEYVLEDNSTNGSFLNNESLAIGRGNQVPLNDGDLIRMGDYLIQVSTQPAAQKPGIENPAPAPPDLGPPPGILSEHSETPAEQKTDHEPAEAKLGDIEGNLGAFESVKPTPLAGSLLGDSAPPSAGASRNVSRSNSGLGLGRNPEPEGLVVPTSSRHDPRPILSESDSLPATGLKTTPSTRTADKTSAAPARQPANSASTGRDDVIPENWLSDESTDFRSISDSDNPFQASASLAPAAPPEAPSASNDVTDITPAGPSAPVATNTATAGQSPNTQKPATPASGSDQGSEISTALRHTLSAVLGELGEGVDDAALLRVVDELVSIVAIMTPQLMAAVSSRAQFKETLRLKQTLIRARENNPLKVSGDHALTLRRLLLNDEPGMLHGQEAVEEAFTELANHQSAMIAALKPALKSTLECLSPERIETGLPASSIDRLAIAGRRGKLWGEYCAVYEKMMQADGRSVEQQFLSALADQYDAALLRIDR